MIKILMTSGRSYQWRSGQIFKAQEFIENCQGDDSQEVAGVFIDQVLTSLNQFLNASYEEGIKTIVSVPPLSKMYTYLRRSLKRGVIKDDGLANRIARELDHLHEECRTAEHGISERRCQSRIYPLYAQAFKKYHHEDNC